MRSANELQQQEKQSEKHPTNQNKEHNKEGLTNTKIMMKQESINKNTKKRSTRNSKKNTKYEKKQKNNFFFMNENRGTFTVKAILNPIPTLQP